MIDRNNKKEIENRLNVIKNKKLSDVNVNVEDDEKGLIDDDLNYLVDTVLNYIEEYPHYPQCESITTQIQSFSYNSKEEVESSKTKLKKHVTKFEV